MDLKDIKIRNSIVHVLNSSNNKFILSSESIQYDSELQEYFKRHILLILESDDAKDCEFRENSAVLEMLKNERDFVTLSQMIAKELYKHMEQHKGIPSGDLQVLQIECLGSSWLALLKMNYIETYTHESEKVNQLQVIQHSNVFPKSTTKLKEAALINLDDLSVRVLEKKFEVNDIKAYYFSGLFLKCRRKISEKEKIRFIKNSFDLVLDKFFKKEIQKTKYSVQFKALIAKQYEKGGEINTYDLTEKMFKDNLKAKEELKKILEKNDLVNSKIKPNNVETVRKISRHKVITDTGIEIIIPMQFSNNRNIELIENENGVVTISIKNVKSFKNQ